MSTRCRMPPENSCGYCRARRLGVGDAGLAHQLDGPLAGRRAGRDAVRDAGSR